MKKKAKTTKTNTGMVRKTLEEVLTRKLSAAERKGLKRLEALPDDQIDTSDIPSVSGKKGWVRIYDHPEHPFYPALTQPISIRIPLPDLEIARELAAEKGVAYQTYMKTLLHEALKRERSRAH